jgi:cell division protein FtsW
MAIANGGILGKGPGNSTQRAFLPQASSDFIFAIVLEEYGFVSAVFILFLYLILLYRCIRLVRMRDKPFAGFIALGLSFSLVFQALMNMGVAVDLFPVTGQPLPLISMGGTSILFTMMSLGILLSVSQSQDQVKPVEPKA